MAMLKIGDVAPEFILTDQQDEEVSLTGFLQSGPIILYFYPADFTPGCTKEACAFRDIYDDILSVGLQVVGVSPQDAASHAKFRDEHDLPFTLVCDPDKIAIKMYGVDGPLGMGVRRVTYLVSQGQKIQDALCADIKIDKHKTFIQRAIVLRESAGMKVKTNQDQTPPATDTA
jgi:peroxiredoxin Q/BCP